MYWCYILFMFMTFRISLFSSSVSTRVAMLCWDERPGPDAGRAPPVPVIAEFGLLPPN